MRPNVLREIGIGLGLGLAGGLLWKQYQWRQQAKVNRFYAAYEKAQKGQ